ncbi:hypothetical protein DP129_12475 [Clostridium tetani]|uniref:hypothetical protein n=1 Tax=Clostridium tetani TaxID=1513 RepID=UPI00100BD7A3|nr:hypothetical protein [Clostridium tetani]RXI38155.1 hypothetical protein DP129_12475 [Clostridium tetani]
MKNKLQGYVLSICGLISLGISIFLIGDSNKGASGLLLGLGVVLLIFGIYRIFESLIYTKEEIFHRKDQAFIEENDERNQAILKQASFITSKVITGIIILLIIILAVLGYDTKFIMILAGVIIIKVLLLIFFADYYSKRI